MCYVWIFSTRGAFPDFWSIGRPQVDVYAYLYLVVMNGDLRWFLSLKCSDDVDCIKVIRHYTTMEIEWIGQMGHPRKAYWNDVKRIWTSFCLSWDDAPVWNNNTRLTAFCPGLPGWAGTRKVKPIWILLKQETASGSGIRWAIYKSAPRSRQITTPAHHRSVFYRPDALPAAQPTVSKHWRQNYSSLE